MSGGPISIPTVAYVATSDIATPGAYFLDLLVMVNVIGKIAATPNPAIENPIRAGIK